MSAVVLLILGLVAIKLVAERQSQILEDRSTSSEFRDGNRKLPEEQPSHIQEIAQALGIA